MEVIMPGRWKFERDRELAAKNERRRKKECPTSFVLETEHLDFLRRKSEECSVRLNKIVGHSHIVRALIRQAIDEAHDRERVWNEKDLF
jgi:hypothetical protein